MGRYRNFMVLGLIAMLSLPQVFAQKNAKAPKVSEKTKDPVGKAVIKSSGDSTSIDFDSTEISAERKMPLGSVINQTPVEKDYDLIKIRTHWHQQILLSTHSLEIR